MPKTTPEDVLNEIEAAEHMQQLGVIMHKFPDRPEIDAETRDGLCKKIEQRRVFLKEKRWIVCMTLDQRQNYINLYTRYGDKSELVQFATQIQHGVNLAVKDNNYDQSFAELKRRSLMVTDYLSKQNKFVISLEYAIHVAINDGIATMILEKLSSDIKTMKTDDIKELLITLGQEISSVTDRYDYLCEHVGTLQECYQLAVGKYAERSSDQLLQAYVHQTSAKRGMPIRKINKMINKI